MLIQYIGASALILDSCRAVDVFVDLPEFMRNTFRIHGRQYEGVSLGVSGASAVPSGILPSDVGPGDFSGVVSSSVSSVDTSTPFFAISTTFTTSIGGSSTVETSTVETSTTAVNTGGVTTSSAPSSKPSSGLSSGAKIGIGVAIPLGVIILVAAIFIFYWRRKHLIQQKNEQEKNSGRPPQPTANITELENNSPSQNYSKKRADISYVKDHGEEIHEMHDNNSYGHSPWPRVSSHELNSDNTNSGYELTATDNPHNDRLETTHISSITATSRESVSKSSPKSSSPTPWENSGEIPYLGANLGVRHAPPDDDEDLREMQDEISVIKERKERLMKLQELEEREEQLMKRIEERKKTGVVSPPREERKDSGKGSS